MTTQKKFSGDQRPVHFFRDQVLRSDFDKETKLVAYTVAQLMDSWKSECWATRQTIARYAGLSKPTVMNRVTLLLDMGWLVLKEGTGTGRGNPSKLRLPLDELGQLALPVREEEA